MTANPTQLPPVGSTMSADQFNQLKGGSSLPPIGSSIPVDQFNQMKGQTAPSNPSFLQDEGSALGKLWNTASSPQDASSLAVGGGAAADAMVNIPASHAIQAVANLPGIKQALPFVGQAINLANPLYPIQQAIGGAVDKADQSLKTNYPKTSAALSGVGKMVKAGLTTSAIGQGVGAVKNFMTGGQAFPEISQTLQDQVGYSPEEASDAVNGLSSIRNGDIIARQIQAGNIPAAQAALNHITATASATDLPQIQKVAQIMEDLSSQTSLEPTLLHSLANTAGNAVHGTEGLLGSTLKGAAQATGLLAPLAGLGYLGYNYVTGK